MSCTVIEADRIPDLRDVSQVTRGEAEAIEAVPIPSGLRPREGSGWLGESAV